MLYQLALPVGLWEMALTSLHNDMGHLGIERILEPGRSNTKDILAMTDLFTRYAVAISTRDQKAGLRGKIKLAD